MDLLGRLRGDGKSGVEKQAERLNRKAATQIVKGDLGQAEAVLREALKLAPEMGASHHNLGALYLKQKKFDAALRELQRAVRLDPGDVESKIAIAKVYADMGKADKALAEYRKVCAGTPSDWRAQISLGNALLERGDLDEAIEHLEKAVGIKPKEELAHLVLAVALERKGDLERAVAEYEQVRRTSILGSNRKAAADKIKELENRRKNEGKEG